MLLSDALPNIRACVESVFDLNGHPPCAAPENIARLLHLCIDEGNIHTATNLQKNRLTMDAIFMVLEKKFLERNKPLYQIVYMLHL